MACKAAAYFMWRGGTKANDVNDTDYSFIVSTKSRALFFNKSASNSRAFISGQMYSETKSCFIFWQNPSILRGILQHLFGGKVYTPEEHLKCYKTLIQMVQGHAQGGGWMRFFNFNYLF